MARIFVRPRTLRDGQLVEFETWALALLHVGFLRSIVKDDAFPQAQRREMRQPGQQSAEDVESAGDDGVPYIRSLQHEPSIELEVSDI